MSEDSKTDKEREIELLKGFLSGTEPKVRHFFQEYGGIIQKAVSSVGIKDRSITNNDLFMAAVENLLRDDKKSLRLFKGKCKLSTYIYTISRRCAIEQAQQSIPPGPDPDTLCTPDALVSQFGIKESKMFKMALQKCKPWEQIFIRMMFYDECSTIEILDFFGWKSESTVYSQKNKIIRKLKTYAKRLQYLQVSETCHKEKRN